MKNMMKKFELEPNLRFIWHDLMDDISRNYAKTAFVRVLFGTILMIASPYAVGIFIDGMTNQSFDAFLMGGALFIGLKLGNMVIGWWRQQVREYFFQQAFWYIPQSITRLYFQRPLAWLSGGTSEIDGGGVESLKNKVWNVSGNYIFQIIPGWSTIVFSILACLYAHVGLGLIAIAYIVVERLFASKANARIHREMRPVIDQFKRWDRRMQEWWRNTDHVKSHGVESKILRQVKTEVQEALRGDDAVWRIFFAKYVAVHRFRGILFSVGLYGLMGYLMFYELITLAIAILVFFSFERIITVLGEINDQQREVQFDLVSVAKYRRVLSERVPFLYNEGKDFDEKTIGIAFDNVTHCVGDGKECKAVLRDVNLTIGVGEKVGIVGPSGAGKSQLLSLLVRATDPTEGKVLVSGHDLKDLKLESLLRYYGVILQKSEPFEDSVLGNMLFGVSHLDLEKSFEDLDENARESLEAKAKGALERSGLPVEHFSEGLHTHIGYKGLKLSGGQQQRLQIAAAHLKLNLDDERPRLVIADEPTASLDSLSELTVMENFQKQLPEDTTMLMVAHRLSTVADMDRIIFVRPLEDCSDGRAQVTMHDSLDELYRQEELFRLMADAQRFVPQ